MTVIDPLDFSPIVVAPYLATTVLMLRRYFRKDGSGNRKQTEEPFAQTALLIGIAAAVLAAVIILTRLFHVVIPYGSIWFGAVGLIGVAYGIKVQRREKPAPVKSRELVGARAQQDAAISASNQLKKRPFGSPRR